MHYVLGVDNNKPTPSLFTGRMPFLSPNQQCQSTEGKMSHLVELLTRNSPGGLPTLCLTTAPGYLEGVCHAYQPLDVILSASACLKTQP